MGKVDHKAWMKRIPGLDTSEGNNSSALATFFFTRRRANADRNALFRDKTTFSASPDPTTSYPHLSW